MSFIKLITFAFANELDRTLISLFDANSNSLLNEQSYQEFLELVLGKNKRYSKASALNGMIKSCERQTEWQGALRHLMVAHKLIHDLSERGLEEIPLQKMQHLGRFATPENSTKIFVHNAIVSRYYNYLQKLSLNYEDLSICFYSQDQIADKLTENNLSPLHALSKLQNTLKNLMKMFPAFEIALHDFTPCTLVKEAAFYCLKDCIHYYKYIDQIVRPLITEFFKLPDREAIFVYEIYAEHILISRKLEALAFPRKLREFSIKSVELYKMDQSYNSKMELYVKELRVTLNSARAKTEQLPQETLQLILKAFASSNAVLPQKDSLFESKNTKRDDINHIKQPNSGRPRIQIQINGENLGPDWLPGVGKSRGELDIYYKNSSENQPSNYPLFDAGGPSFCGIIEDANSSPMSSHRSEIP